MRFPEAGGRQPHIRHNKDSTAKHTPPNTKHGVKGTGGETQMPSGSSSRRLGAPLPTPSMGRRHLEISPLLVQWDCSPLQVLCKPGAGGNRPAGSSKMQDWAQPPAGRWERRGAPGTVLLVGTRGTRKGSGHQHSRWGRWEGSGRREVMGMPLPVLSHLVTISYFKWSRVRCRIFQ